MLTRTTLGTACLLTLVSGAALAGSTFETTIRFDEALAADARVHVENLIGSIRIRGVDPREGFRIEGRVLAEAKTEPQARELAEAVRFVATGEPNERSIRLDFPTDRHRQFRVPAVGFGGMVGKWVTPLVRKSTVALQYGEHSIQVGQQRSAAAVSVELTVHLPFDQVASFRQVIGSIDLYAARGDLSLEVIEGQIDVEQLFGRLAVQSGGGDVALRRFQGENLVVQSGSGAVELLDVRVERGTLTSAAGAIRAQGLEGAELAFRTAGGDIELAQLESAAFTIETGSGNVAIASQMKSLTAASIESTSGNVVLRVGGDRGFDVSARTQSGDITIYRMELGIVTEGGKTIARRGRGGPAIDVATPGGKLTVRPDDGNWSARMTRR